MKVLFIATSVENGLWLAELTHPFWHLTERGVDVDFASPVGEKISWNPLSDPYASDSQEGNDIVSKGFLADKALIAKTETTLPLASLDLTNYDAVHVAGGGGAAIDLYPSAKVGEALEHFFSAGKVIGALCHGVIALGNNPDRIKGRHVTGYSLAEDEALEKFFGKNFLPNYPQPVLEKAGAHFSCAEPNGLRVIVDGKLITGQSQYSASEYSIVFHHLLTGSSPVHETVAA